MLQMLYKATSLLLNMVTSRPGSLQPTLLTAERSLGLPCRPTVVWGNRRQQTSVACAAVVRPPPAPHAGPHAGSQSSSTAGPSASNGASSHSNGNSGSNGNGSSAYNNGTSSTSFGAAGNSSNGSSNGSSVQASSSTFAGGVPLQQQAQQQLLRPQGRSLGPPRRLSTKDIAPANCTALLQKMKQQAHVGVRRGAAAEVFQTVQGSVVPQVPAHYLYQQQQQQPALGQQWQQQHPQAAVVQSTPSANGNGNGHSPYTQPQLVAQQQPQQPQQPHQPQLPQPVQPPWQPFEQQQPVPQVTQQQFQQQQQQQLQQQQQQQASQYAMANGSNTQPMQPAAAALYPLSSSAAAAGSPFPADAAVAAAGGDGEPPVDWSAVEAGPGGSLWALPSELISQVPPDVCVVDSPAAAKAVVDQMLQMAQEGIQYQDANGTWRTIPAEEVVFACDTEVADIDVKTQSPVGHGTVICFSVYAGPWADFAAAGSSSSSSTGDVVAAAAATAAADGLQQLQHGQPRASRIWVDLTGGWFETRKVQFEKAQLDAQQADEAAAAAKQEAAATRGAKGKAASGTISAGIGAEPSSRSVSGGTAPAAAAADGLYTETELKKKAMLKSHLQDIAAQRGLSYPGKATKADLIAAILQHQEQHGPQEELLEVQPSEELQSGVQELQQQPPASVGSELLLQDELQQRQLPHVPEQQLLTTQDTVQLQDQPLQAPAGAAEPAGAGAPVQQPEASAAPAASRSRRRSRSAARRSLSTAAAQQFGLPDGLSTMLKSEVQQVANELLRGSACYEWVGRKTTVEELQDLLLAAAEARAAGSSVVMPESLLSGIVARATVSLRNVNKQQLLACLDCLGQPAAPELTNTDLLQRIQEVLVSRDANRSTTVGSSSSSSSSSSSDFVVDLPGDSSSRGGSGPTVAAAGVSIDVSSSSSSGGGVMDGFEYSSGSSTSPRPRRSSTSSSTASTGWSPPRRGGLAVSGVLGSSAELAPPSVEELRLDPTAAGILSQFERFFCSDVPKKVWHNYGFDRHVLEGLLGKDDAGRQKKLAGFDGDTLHMSRLHDASRKTKGGYGLEALSSDAQLADKLREAFKKRYGEASLELLAETDTSANAKRSMKERFGLRKVKADSSGLVKAPLVSPVHLLQLDERFRYGWIDYSALDAKATWNIHYALKYLLQKDMAVMDVYLANQLAGIQPPHSPSTPEQQEQAWRVAGMQSALKTATQAESCARAYAAQIESGAAQAAVKHNQHTAGSGAKKGKLVPPPRGSKGAKAGQAAAAAQQEPAAAEPSGSYTMWDLYKIYWRPFGDVLSAMESEGVRVNREHLAEQEQQAKLDQAAAMKHFRDWACRYVKGAQLMNVNSQVQIRQLLFPDQCAEPVKAFKAENPQYDPDVRPRFRRWIDYEIHGIWGAGQPGRLQPEVQTKKGLAAVSTAVLWSLVGKPGAAAKALAELDAAEAAAAGPDNSSTDSAQYPSTAAAAADASVLSMIDEDPSPHEVDGDEDVDTAAGATAAAAAAGAAGEGDAELAVRTVPGGDLTEARLAELEAEAAAKKLGKMYAAMGGGREGLEACMALEKLIEMSLIERLLTAFIQPLQQDNISTTHPRAEYEQAALPATSASSSNSSSSSSGLLLPADTSSSSSGGLLPDWPEHIYRVHCSLNLNTETGRLSARRPNLQNQPALEKDRYKVRKAFCAEPGKTLIVADYGQLELRLLAHMAECKSMIEAFELGGDFHSRTALGMYDHIKDAIAREECLLEWDFEHDGPTPTAPLLKDKFASERRKAKILNFSIAYGKTAHGLSKDWGVTLDEAEETVKRWYADRPEVERWQREQRAYAANVSTGHVNTMIGRRRGLKPGINSSDKWIKARAERAAINTPIQGSAADVASAAMLSIVMDRELKEMGWKLLLQVHDEVMLEGPKGSADLALARVVECMENPWKNLMGLQTPPLRVQLAVDANIAGNWYEAK